MGLINFNRGKKSDNLRDVLPTYKHRKQADIFEVFMDRDNEGRLTQKMSITQFRTFAEGSTVEILQETVNSNVETIADLMPTTNSFVGKATQSSTSNPVLTGIKFRYDTTLGFVTMTRFQKGWYDLVFPFTVTLAKTSVAITGLQHGTGKAASTYVLEEINANTIRIKTLTNVGGSLVSEDDILKDSTIYVEALPL